MDDTDRVLHAERLEGRAKRLHPGEPGLPDGSIVADGDDAFMVWRGRTWKWSMEGYDLAEAPASAQLLTPPSTVLAMRRGYRPAVHESAG